MGEGAAIAIVFTGSAASSSRPSRVRWRALPPRSVSTSGLLTDLLSAPLAAALAAVRGRGGASEGSGAPYRWSQLLVAMPPISPHEESPAVGGAAPEGG